MQIWGKKKKNHLYDHKKEKPEAEVNIMGWTHGWGPALELQGLNPEAVRRRALKKCVRACLLKGGEEGKKPWKPLPPHPLFSGPRAGSSADAPLPDPGRREKTRGGGEFNTKSIYSPFKWKWRLPSGSFNFPFSNCGALNTDLSEGWSVCMVFSPWKIKTITKYRMNKQK